MKPMVTIGLCVRNAAVNIKTALDGISIQDYPHDCLKLVIAVDGSGDNMLSLASEFNRKTSIATFVVFNKNNGLGAARQAVVDNSEAKYIVWVDDDFVLAKDFVTKHVEFMENRPKVGAACSTVLPTQRTIINLLDTMAYLIPKNARCGAGGSIFRLEAIQAAQGFDSEIKGAGEDWDISHRIAESGWILASNDRALLHRERPPSTPAEVWWKYCWYGYGNHLLYHKFKDEGLLLPYYPLRSFGWAIRVSSTVYRTIRKKRVFLYPIYSLFISLAWNFGFIRAHIAGYGHFS